VTGYRTRRLATVVSSALIGLLLLGTSVVTASTPGWGTSNVTTIPTDGIVAPNNNAAYVVTIRNTGKSNITALQLGTDLPSTAPNTGFPTYVGPIVYTGQAGAGQCSAKKHRPARL
jgi:hypothetical protein